MKPDTQLMQFVVMRAGLLYLSPSLREYLRDSCSASEPLWQLLADDAAFPDRSNADFCETAWRECWRATC